MQVAFLGLAFVAALGPACASIPRSNDYGISFTCAVVDEAGMPIAGAEVTLELGSTAYQGVEPTKGEKQVTPAAGFVVFMYITHELSSTYSIAVSKAGYPTVKVLGTAQANKEGTHVKVVLGASPKGGVPL